MFRGPFFSGHCVHTARMWVRVENCFAGGDTLQISATPLHHIFGLLENCIIVALSVTLWYNFIKNKQTDGQRDRQTG